MGLQCGVLECNGLMNSKQPEANEDLQLLTTAQAASLLNVHPNTVRNWADASLLPAYRIGPRRDRRFRRVDVESLLTEDDGHRKRR